MLYDGFSFNLFTFVVYQLIAASSTQNTNVLYNIYDFVRVYSHSIVAGGLEVMSYTTRFT